jgi:hypothetical protein
VLIYIPRFISSPGTALLTRVNKAAAVAEQKRLSKKRCTAERDALGHK